MLKKYPRLILAGIRGGSGKTTATLAVITALMSKKNLSVIPFKKGPDYIDAGWLSMFANSPCYNLDPFLISKENVLKSFISHFKGDIAVIEGNRGLYDGMDIEGSFSTAELAKILKAPCILIIDCSKITRTAAALVKGCMEFDKGINIKGIILNQIAGSRHESIIRDSIQRYCSISVVGAIPRLKGEPFPERHMGLMPHQEHPDSKNASLIIKQIADNYIDIDQIFSIALDAETFESPAEIYHSDFEKLQIPLKIGVIRDSAFQFYYPENLEELIKRGAQIIDINALFDTKLPEIDALYIGGGFPETNAISLAKNESFRNSIKKAATEGLPIYAECGGLMFLGKEIIIGDSKFPMVGIFPIVFEMKRRPQAHGYTIVEIDSKNPFYPPNTILHGHEFHYSKVKEISGELHTSFKMLRGEGLTNKRDGISWKNTLATYTHIHALGSKAWVNGLINIALKYKSREVN